MGNAARDSKRVRDVLSASELHKLQTEQFRHDQRNHSDIICLSKPDRLKHYGLHFAKYAGRMARGTKEAIAFERTVTDAALVCFSAANTLHQRLDAFEAKNVGQQDHLLVLTDAAGRFADACEKIDHLEEFVSIAREANLDILNWILVVSADFDFDLRSNIMQRRKELASRQFFVEET
ncbi:hypothetical protein J2Y55_003078 [Bosea sp. BE125]|uniref:hypothetical protein n=1 Tax=Bosea sp. BE125 TaxID=2817909 RepID=UPI00285573D6|nr:hypothetical protein [Bosea sp. BE125]MDR6872062.1 hypothetical protein [Bosea sp. BE125]